jgi:deoxyhypusine monooxygenase
MSDSALLRHEVAYVLGQMQNKVAIPKLIEVLSNELEHVMVRHEAAEALGAIGDYSVIPVLQKYLNHQLPEISESCEVAIDLLDWTKSKEYDAIDC